MSESALVQVVQRILASGYDPVAAIVEDETARGFKVIRPGDARGFLQKIGALPPWRR